jgi:hypothetical protein
MTDETDFWQDMAATLDPAAYEWIEGNSISRTVPSGETWYVQEAWFVQVIEGGGVNWFHRGGDARDAFPIPAGTTLVTDASKAFAHMYLCKPSLVTGSDSRYTTDPRALYFNRLRRLSSELELHQIGGTQTNNATGTATLPTDFVNGMVVHVSTHDLAWIIPYDAAEHGGIITQFEVSDTDRVRVANNVLIPFVRAAFPKIIWRGATQTEGRGTITYVKLPSDW